MIYDVVDSRFDKKGKPPEKSNRHVRLNSSTIIYYSCQLSRGQLELIYSGYNYLKELMRKRLRSMSDELRGNKDHFFVLLVSARR